MKKNNIFLLVFAISIQTLSCSNDTRDQMGNVKDTIITKKPYSPPNIKSPDEAIAEIKAGNERFLKHQLINTNITEMIEHSSGDQHPFVAVLGCIDSRVPAEFVFDQGIGNMFVARVAGNVEDPFILGSLEYATKIKGAKLIVVLGHNNCGAINGAIDGVELGNLTPLLKQIKPAITPDSAGNKLRTANNTSRRNVQLTMERIHKKSPVINELIKSGDLKMIGAYYDVTSGKTLYEDDLKKWW
jgi:carbonic anhydrase